MKSTDLPARVPVPFAANGARNVIPAASQIAIKAGAASFNDGFPPLTFTPVAAGGVPPFGQDFNGVFYALSALSRWMCAGGPMPYDSGFSAAIGGYPIGAQLASTVQPGIVWTSLADNNTDNPETGTSALWTARAQPSASFRLAVSQSLAVPFGYTRLRARVWGAGGGAGSSANSASAGAGGGGGGYLEAEISGLAYNQSLPFTIGGGGAAGNGTNAGGAGGTTSIGSYLSCTGGTGGGYANGAASTAPGTGGGPTTAAGVQVIDLYTGVGGGQGYPNGSSGMVGAPGGSSFASGAVYPPTSDLNTPKIGFAGVFPGQGGCGGVNGGTGGAGAGGLILGQWLP